ncbi:hypothetical protein F9K33_05450 [bacterium]|nr:MAG: hypothetical protein F9K33_05450 [bacterium]MBL7960048.1 hypothetical protein [bacterium]
MKWLNSKTLLVLFAMVLVSSCTSYASKEEVQQLDEKRASVKAMENKVVELTNEKKKADQELQQKKQKLDQVKKDKEEVLKRLEAIEKANK